MGKTALVIGATGLVGRELVHQLLEHPDYDKVKLLLRRKMDLKHQKLEQHVFNFDAPDGALVSGDDLYCAMGTTLKKAGSKEAQFCIDCIYPVELGRIARENGFRQYLLVSSVGADARSKNFYLRTKGELEEKIGALEFEHFVSIRPSFLLGNREEFRLGEKIGIVLAGLFRPLIPKSYRGVQASAVAASLIAAANKGMKGNRIIRNEDIVSP